MTDITAASMKLKFPEFAEQDDASIEFAIEEAARNVDDTWLAKDKNLAWMYMAAHYLSVAINNNSDVNNQQVQSERIGEISVTYANAPQPTLKDSTDLASTTYGMRYRELSKLNFPPVMVI
jgi:hypothetical protein